MRVAESSTWRQTKAALLMVGAVIVLRGLWRIVAVWQGIPLTSSVAPWALAFLGSDGGLVLMLALAAAGATGFWGVPVLRRATGDAEVPGSAPPQHRRVSSAVVGLVWVVAMAFALGDLTDQVRRNVLSHSVSAGDHAGLQAYLELGYSPDEVIGGISPLQAAATLGDVEAMTRLLKAGADPDYAPSGASPLLRAALAGPRPAVDVLLAAGATPDDPGRDKALVPLVAAAGSGDAQMVSALLAAGAEIDAAGVTGLTALHAAAKMCQHDAARVLIEQGAGTNLVDARGQTPLHWAAAKADAQMVAMLLDAGADPSLETDGGQTALDWALRLGNDEATALLSEHGGCGAAQVDHLPSTAACS
jgi:hypothetical protein